MGEGVVVASDAVLAAAMWTSNFLNIENFAYDDYKYKWKMYIEQAKHDLLFLKELIADFLGLMVMEISFMHKSK